MCGVVAVLGNVDQKLVERIVEESRVRGLHHLGKAAAYANKRLASIWHARYCTSGMDNQPIVHEDGGSYLAMNGVIDMGTKKEMEQRHGVKMRTDNDAELLLQYLDSYSFEELCVLWPKASIAGVILTKKKLYAFRNARRPLWMIEKKGSVLIASTQDIFRRAEADWKKAKQLKPEKVYTWTI